MAYNNQKGTQHTGDIQYEGDPNDTQIDFENDLVAIKTNGEQRFIVSGSFITSSIPISCSAGITAGTFTGVGSGLTGIPASSVGAAGSDTQVQFNNSGDLDGSNNLTFDSNTLTTANLSVDGNSTLGDASGDSVTINAATITLANVAAGVDNTVLVYEASNNTIATDEIDSRVWGSTLVDVSPGTATANQVATWSDSNTVAGSNNLTFNGSILDVKATTIISGAFTTSGSSTIGTNSSHVATVNGQLTASMGVTLSQNSFVASDKTILFGSSGQSAIQFNSTSGRLVISGSDGNTGVPGLDLKGKNIVVDVAGGTVASGTLAGPGSYLCVDENNKIVLASAGGSAAITTYNTAGDNRVVVGTADSSTVEGSSNLTFDGSELSVIGDVTAVRLSSSFGLHLTGGNPHVAIGDEFGGGAQAGMLQIRPSDTSNKVLCLMQGAEVDGMRLAFGVSGSGQVLVGGNYLAGMLNVSGSNAETLISAKSNTLEPAFSVGGTGAMHLSGNMTIKGNPNVVGGPMIHFSSSIDDAVKAHIGLNNAGNILLQNNTNNKHIVFKATDSGVVKEGLRLDGAVPEVVVNQTPASLVNFRVESETNTHMLYVTGSDQVGIGVSDPAPEVTLDISGSAIRLRNSSTPTNASSPGAQGEIRWDSNYLYICIATDTWRRIAHSTW